MKKQIVIFVVGLVVILAAGGAVYYYKFYKTVPPSGVNENQNVPVSTITNFEECAAAGNPVMESYPRQCRANGQNFTENIGNELEKTDLIRIDSPRPNTIVTSSLQVTGQARGYWYFEASFPVKLFDSDGNVLAQTPAQAQSDWMTNDFVPYKATLEFIAPATDSGTLVLEKDNPSNLPQNADSLIVPVRFR
jgi:hypothetical protein